jgi:hypothetical protein
MTTSDLLDALFEHEPTLVTRRVADEVILVPTRLTGEDAALFTLDEVAAFLWERLDGRRTGRDLVNALEAAYQTGHEQAEQDVRTFLEQLRSIQAIRAASRTYEPTNPSGQPAP